MNCVEPSVDNDFGNPNNSRVPQIISNQSGSISNLHSTQTGNFQYQNPAQRGPASKQAVNPVYKSLSDTGSHRRRSVSADALPLATIQSAHFENEIVSSPVRGRRYQKSIKGGVAGGMGSTGARSTVESRLPKTKSVEMKLTGRRSPPTGDDGRDYEGDKLRSHTENGLDVTKLAEGSTVSRSNKKGSLLLRYSLFII